MHPLRIEIAPAGPELESLLENLLELYAHDLSEYFDVPLQPSGRFGYPPLPLYWREEGRFPFIVKADQQIAGFILVSRGSRISHAPQVWDVAEFFIMRGYRKQGIGATAAAEVFRRFPGRWEVRVLENNVPALAFWKSAIRSFAMDCGEAPYIDSQHKAWRVFSFESPLRDHAPIAPESRVPRHPGRGVRIASAGDGARSRAAPPPKGDRMRPPRYRFPDEVRNTTREIASRMVREGTIAGTPDELHTWIQERPDVREGLEAGGYGTAFTADDLHPLLQVLVEKAGGTAPGATAPTRASPPRWLIPGVLLVVVLVVLFLLLR